MREEFWWGLAVLVAAAGLVSLWAYCKTQITYHIGQENLRIRLFGICLRAIPFDQIDKVDKPRRDLLWSETENWRNTFDDSHRLLVVHLRRRRFPKLVITPPQRYEFRARLREVLEQRKGRFVPLSVPDED